MPNLSVEISRFVDDWQPGFVECTLLDAQSERHLFVDKVPIFTTERLDASSRYPQPGFIPCRIEAEWRDEQGRSLIRISTGMTIDSTAGQSSFVVLASQVLP